MSHTVLVYQKFFARNFNTEEEAKEFANKHYPLDWKFLATCTPDEDCPVCKGRVIFDMEHEVSLDVVNKGPNLKLEDIYS